MTKATVKNESFKFDPAYGPDVRELFRDDIEKPQYGKRNKDKALAGVYIMKIVEHSATPEKPVSQAKIIRILRDRYGIEIGRAAVGRIIHALADSPFGVCFDCHGVWCEENKVWED